MPISRALLVIGGSLSSVGAMLLAVGGQMQGHGNGLAAGVTLPATAAPLPAQAKVANFLRAKPSPEARQVADWAMASGDNHGLPFVIIDKIGARVFIFGANGLLLGTSMVLLGLARGDDQPADIGTRKLAAIPPRDRITPAGRFIAVLGRDLEQEILWVDYTSAISLHRVVRGNPGDHRRERLLGLSPSNKRITYGCINVPPKFFDDVVRRAFKGTTGIVYILPEQRKLSDVFHISAPGQRP
jgi:hypothetical protein